MNRLQQENQPQLQLSCLGRPLQEYQIVYPENSDLGEYFVALDLRYHLFYDAGIDVRVVSDGEESAEWEILVGRTNRGFGEPTEGCFEIRVAEKALLITAENLYGFLEADEYLVHTLLREADRTDLLREGFSIRRTVKNLPPKKTGEFRMLLQNIWGVDWGADHMANRDLYAAAFLLSFEPDLLFVNEYWTAMRKIERFQKSILRNGYTEVAPENWSRPNVLPIFYRTDSWEQVECNCYDLRGGDESKTMTLAVLRHKPTGKLVTCCCTHLEASWNCAREVGAVRQVNDVRLLAPILKDLLDRYPDSPFLYGADCNCTAGSIPLRMLESLGLSDANGLASDKDNKATHHAYPLYDELLGYYVEPAPNRGTGPYSSAIDHIFCSGSLIPRVYRTADGDFPSLYSDHYGVLFEFDLPHEAE